MTGELETAKVRFHKAQAAFECARNELNAAREAFDLAKVVAACETPHAWAGLKVKRAERQRGGYSYGYWGKRNPDRNVTKTGVVTLYGVQTRYRNYQPAKGEWFVLSASGATAYKLDDAWELV